MCAGTGSNATDDPLQLRVETVGKPIPGVEIKVIEDYLPAQLSAEEAGAAAVLVSGLAAEADVTLVMGANEGDLGDHRIISNASCTTNALAPLARLLDEEYGLISGQMTTVHCYTGSQPTVDKPRVASTI